MYIITATAEPAAIAYTIEDAVEYIHKILDIEWETESWYCDRSLIKDRIEEAEAEDDRYTLWLIDKLELRCYVNPVIVKKFGA